MTLHRKQSTVVCEILTVVADVQRWPDVVAGISVHFSKFAFVLFRYTCITNHFMTGPLGNNDFLYLSNLNVSLNFVLGNNEILRKQNSLFSSGPVIKR